MPTSSDRYPQAWIVVAAYKEAAVIADVVRSARSRFENVVVVDDGSPDDTAYLAQQAGAHVLRHPINRGQGAALQTGITWALQQGAAFVITFDGDGQHDPDDAVKVLAPVLEGRAAAVFGDRLSEHADSVPPGRRILLRAAVVFSRLMSGVRLHDAHNGLRAFNADLASRLNITLDGMAHASEIADQVHRSGLTYTEVPVRIAYTEHSRRKGQSWNAAFGIAFDYLLGRLLR